MVYSDSRIKAFRKQLGAVRFLVVKEALASRLAELEDGSVCSISNGRPLTADMRSMSLKALATYARLINDAYSARRPRSTRAGRHPTGQHCCCHANTGQTILRRSSGRREGRSTAQCTFTTCSVVYLTFFYSSAVAVTISGRPSAAKRTIVEFPYVTKRRKKKTPVYPTRLASTDRALNVRVV